MIWNNAKYFWYSFEMCRNCWDFSTIILVIIFKTPENIWLLTTAWWLLCLHNVRDCNENNIFFLLRRIENAWNETKTNHSTYDAIACGFSSSSACLGGVWPKTARKKTHIDDLFDILKASEWKVKTKYWLTTDTEHRTPINTFH